MKKQNGFTLVEIAIVLVVIGLLLGGVLKGQELLENGRIRKALNDFNTIAAATFTYQDRYRILPGDDTGANRFVVNGVAVTNSGDTDGVITGAWNATGGTTDTELFWVHLRADGLVEGIGAGQPANAFNGITGVQFGNWNIGQGQEHVICMSNVTTKSAVIIDNRIDDGLTGGATFYQTGSFIITGTAISATPTTLATPAVTINTGGTSFVCREL